MKYSCRIFQASMCCINIFKIHVQFINITKCTYLWKYVITLQRLKSSSNFKGKKLHDISNHAAWVSCIIAIRSTSADMFVTERCARRRGWQNLSSNDGTAGLVAGLCGPPRDDWHASIDGTHIARWLAPPDSWAAAPPCDARSTSSSYSLCRRPSAVFMTEHQTLQSSSSPSASSVHCRTLECSFCSR